MTAEEWENLCVSVKDQMVPYVAQFVTPISMSEEHGSGVAWGSGSYLEGNKGAWLITASHVFEDMPQGSQLAHLPIAGGEYIAITEPPEKAPWPIDAAAARVVSNVGGECIKAIPLDLVADQFSAVKGELFFWIGYPGYKLERHDPIIPDKRRHTLFGELSTLGLPVLTQAQQGEVLEHEAYDHDRHVVLHYPTYAKRAPDQAPVALPLPKGMSGSLLWNTRFLEVTSAGLSWSPDCARVGGVIWAALDNPEVVLATKIEFVRQGVPTPFS